MADPTAYTIAYSFTDYQTASPSDPLPAAKIDIEYANISTSLASLRTSLMNIRRSDGALTNGIVTKDSLAADLKIALVAASDLLVPTVSTTGLTYVYGDLAGVLSKHEPLGLITTELTALVGATAGADFIYGEKDGVVIKHEPMALMTTELVAAPVATAGAAYVYAESAAGAVVKTKYLDDISRLRSGTSTLNIDRVGAEAQSTRWLDAAIYAFGDISTDLNGLSAVNSIVVNDTMKATHGKQISALQVVLSVGGGVTSGTRSAFHSRIAVTGMVAKEPLNDMVSHLATGYSTATQGGDGTITTDIDDGYVGGLWGQNANVWLASGATNYRGLYGIEVNATAMTGSSTYAKAGLFVAKLPTDAVRAVADDAGIMFGSEAGAITWKKGIQFGVTWGQWPFTTDSTLIGVQNKVWPTAGGAMNANYGVDFTGVTFASAAFASTGFSVDNSGNVTGNTLLTYNVTGANYERLSAKWSANVAYIEMEKAGTGTSRDIALKTSTAQWTFKTNGALVIPNYLWMNGGSGSRIYSPADGNITFLNAAANDFTMLQFGGTTASFPALKKSSTTIQAKLADDSAYANFQAKSLIISDGITAPTAVAGLAALFVDVADGDFKIIFGDGVTKTVMLDT